MIYRFARALCRLAFPFFINKRLVEGLQNIPDDRPILLATNHPNSFFDAVLIGVHLQRPIYTLTRADVFRKPMVAKMLRGIKLIPVFRASEGGREYLNNNDQTFAECMAVFQQNGIVVIFAEGICLNQTELLPLKKGVVRLAQQAWANPEIGDRLLVVPGGLWYSSFTESKKNAALRIGKPIEKSESAVRNLTQRLTDELTVLSAAPALGSGSRLIFRVGQVVNLPVDALCQYYARKFTAKTVFYDSVRFGFLMVALPIYWMLLLSLAMYCFL